MGLAQRADIETGSWPAAAFALKRRAPAAPSFIANPVITLHRSRGNSATLREMQEFNSSLPIKLVEAWESARTIFLVIFCSIIRFPRHYICWQCTWSQAILHACVELGGSRTSAQMADSYCTQIACLCMQIQQLPQQLLVHRWVIFGQAED